MVTGKRRTRKARLSRVAGVVVVLIVSVIYVLDGVPGGGGVHGGVPVELGEAISNRMSDVPVTLTAPVVKVLKDDTEGDRHQRLLLGLAHPVGGVDSVLIAHNIDVAPRVPCDRGDTITVHGRYEWNDLGGVIHWTHRDPDGRHEDGWIEFRGQRFE